MHVNLIQTEGKCKQHNVSQASGEHERHHGVPEKQGGCPQTGNGICYTILTIGSNARGFPTGGCTLEHRVRGVYTNYHVFQSKFLWVGIKLACFPKDLS